MIDTFLTYVVFPIVVFLVGLIMGSWVEKENQLERDEYFHKVGQSVVLDLSDPVRDLDLD